MTPVDSPPVLLKLAQDLRVKGAKGFLLSGGCDRGGKLPIGPYLDTLARIKKETGLIVNVHTGLLDLEGAGALVGASPDCCSVDIVQEERVIREIVHLGVGRSAYRETLSSLISSGAKRVVPHICVGLSETSAGERSALRMIEKFDISALVVLVLLPTKGTPMEDHPAVDDDRVVGLVEEAVTRLKCPVLLGCMRPRGNWELEAKCVDEGIAGIAVPSRRTLSWAADCGFDIEVREICCALYR
ncbi:MAG: hypothetical protein ABSB83_01875 [Methanomassiliicoccales archaeon]|jgi:uncharacterized radical SAM superfamily protein